MKKMHVLAALAALGSWCQASAQDFIRGDVNGDGRVSVSDSVAIMGRMFFGAPEIQCWNSADINDDGSVDISDEIFLLTSVYNGGVSIPAPFPEAGADVTLSELDCAQYGGGLPLEDPEARLAVLDATAPGGANRRAVIPIALSNSVPINAYLVRIDGEDIFEPRRSSVRDLSPVPARRHDGFRSTFSPEGGFRYVTLASVNSPVSIPPGNDVTLLEFNLCLEPGTPAGTYPITILDGELAATCGQDQIEDCPDRGRAILPALASGTLTVEADVTEGECDLSVPPEPAEIHILFQLDETTSFPGGEVSVPFSIKSDRPTQGFSYSVKFDDAVLQCTGTRKLWERPSGTPYELERFEWNNFTGYAVGAAVFSLTDSDAVLPVDEIVEVLEIDFDVSPTAEEGSTPLEFRDGGSASGGAVTNKLIASGQEITPSLASSFVFVNGLINIIPDGSPFVRGDSNGDLAINISDPTFTLNYLFVGNEPPRCEDAADANDDGLVNISDPIVTLQFLFLGDTRLPAPGPGPGPDPTSDGLHCLAGS